MTKFPWCGCFRPRFTSFFIGAHEHPGAFLPKVNFPIKINCMQHFCTGAGINFGNFRHVFGQQIHMFHGKHRQFQTHHATNLACPQPGGIHHMFGNDRVFVGFDMPAAICGLRQGFDHDMRFIAGTVFPRGFCIGMRHPIGVDMALYRVIHGADKLFRVDQWHQFMGPLRGDDFQIIHAQIFALGIDGLQPVKSFMGCRQHNTAGHMQANILPGELFYFLI